MKKKNFKTVFVSAGLATASLTTLFAVSCASFSQWNFIGARIYAASMYQQEPLVLDLTQVRNPNDLLKRENIVSSNGALLGIGLFGERRRFYADINKDKTYHYGYDILANEGTLVYAPFDADIIYASFVSNADNTAQVNEGIGGVLVMRVKVSDLHDLSPDEKSYVLSLLTDAKIASPKGNQKDYVYLEMMHLSRKAVLDLGKTSKSVVLGNTKMVFCDEITPEKPLHVTKGQIISQVGSVSENGGWAPHTHVQFINPAVFARLEKQSTSEAFDYESFGHRWMAGVGPRLAIAQGSVLDPNLFLKMVSVPSGTFKSATSFAYLTKYTPTNSKSYKNLEIQRPFYIGKDDFEKLRVSLPPQPDGYGNWSAAVWSANGVGDGAPISQATIRLGMKLRAVYTAPSLLDSTKVLTFIANYLVIKPTIESDITMSDFFIEGSAAPVASNLPDLDQDRKDWTLEYLSDTLDFSSASAVAGSKAGGAFFWTNNLTLPAITNRVFVVQPNSEG